MEDKNNLYQFKFWQLFLIVSFIYIGIMYVSNTMIYSDAFYYNMLSQKMEIARIKDIIEMQHKYQIISYCIYPIILLLKLWSVAGVIFMVLYLLNQEVSYQNCLKITLIAELVSVVAMLVRVVWLLVAKPDNVNDIQYFSPLSLTQLLDLDSLPKYLFYPLQLFNIFEVGYWLVLAYGIMVFTNWKFEKSFKAVASGYGVALAMWAVVVMFIQVQFS